jgi:hypothetical protein
MHCQVAAEYKVFTADKADCMQLLRHLGEQRGAAASWRRARPALLVEAAEFRGADGAAAADLPGTLLLRCSRAPLSALVASCPFPIFRLLYASDNLCAKAAGHAPV